MRRRRILVVGNGGREHSLGWKLAQSPERPHLFFAPGNGGTHSLGENLAVKADNVIGIVRAVQEKRIDLVVVGPDNALAAGLVDRLQELGIPAFGPTIMAANIEASKAYSKVLMQGAGIRTAPFRIFDRYSEAVAHVRTKGPPLVVKADGLALGKGSFPCPTSMEAALAAVRKLMIEKEAGPGGETVVIEDFIEGLEFSAHALCGKKRVELFPFSQDYKHVWEGNKGLMTGGMGVVAPMPMFARYGEEVRDIVAKTLGALESRGIHYEGCLYPGFKINENGLYVLEYNARFGDPECQVYMRLLEDDLLEVLTGFMDGSFTRPLCWFNAGFAASITLAAAGYPGTARAGDPIEGLENARRVDGVEIFHAGTKLESGTYYTAGGRVLHVTAIAQTQGEALRRAYSAVDCIHYKGMHYRKDIGANVPVLA